MTEAGLLGPPVRSRAAGAGIPRRVAGAVSTDALVGVALALLWMLGHGFVGIEGDARIYMGRALADIDPLGVGRDMMFAMDGQSSFTLFRPLARALVATMGLGPTVLVLSFISLVAWFVAITMFVRALVPGRAAALVLAVVFVLPRVYTPWNLLQAGESIPVPRPLAEAGVLLAMAALCHGRIRLGVGALVVAALFHPIMAAPGFAVLLIMLGLRDRRWFLVAALACAAALVAGASGLPLASRLMVRIDPVWRAILDQRVDYVFPSLWPIDSVAPPIVRIVTILIACLWLDGRQRTVFLASAVIGVLGVLVSMLFGDALGDLLVVQAQPWRALWLMAALAPVAAGICLWRLPERGPAGLIALAFLALAWITLNWNPIGPFAAIFALAVTIFAARKAYAFSRVLVVAVWVVCAALACVAQWVPLSALLAVYEKLPPEVPLPFTMIWSLRLLTFPVMALALAWWRWPDAAATRFVAALVVTIGVLLVWTRWDNRLPAHVDADAATPKPDLAAMLAGRPGQVLWIDSDDIWYWLGRPNWNGQTQGGSIVFSRDLALLWHDRTVRMVRYGLADGNMLNPWEPGSLQALSLDRERLAGFCAAPDAPAWIVASLEPGARPPQGTGSRVWVPRLAYWKLYIAGNAIRWRHLDRYAIIPCAGGSTHL